MYRFILDDFSDFVPFDIVFPRISDTRNGSGEPSQSGFVSKYVNDPDIFFAIQTEFWPIFGHSIFILEQTFVVKQGKNYGFDRRTRSKNGLKNDNICGLLFRTRPRS